MARTIGIQHRIKMSAAGEARPTRVFIATSDGQGQNYELPDEQAELDFVTGRFPIAYRAVVEGEDISAIPSWQIKTRKDVIQIPSAYEGIQDGDTVVMVLGGSGDYLASAAARIAARKGGKVLRIAAHQLQKEREARNFENKDQDAQLLTIIVRKKPWLFYEVAERDQGLILVRERQKLRIDSMKARQACEQRLRQRVVGNVFTTPDGLFPEGGIEKATDDLKASDLIYKTLCQEELRAERELTKALEALDVYQAVFKPIEGMGPMIAARIISAVIDIRRFSKASKFTAFAGVHVLKNGTLARRRNGQVANWHGDLRQALYLSSDQWNRRPDSHWGKYFRAMKAGYRSRHPEPVMVEKKGGGQVRRYTDGHIHKMAQWRTMTRFAEKLFSTWQDFERNTREEALTAERKKAA